MKMFAGGREVNIPTDEQGKVNAVEVRRILDIPDNRQVIQQKPTGENFLLPKKGQVQLDSYDQFLESPRAVRG